MGGWGGVGDPLCCRPMRAAPGCSLSLVGARQTGTRAAGQGVGDFGGSRQLHGVESKAGPQAGPVLPPRRFSTRGRPRGKSTELRLHYSRPSVCGSWESPMHPSRPIPEGPYLRESFGICSISPLPPRPLHRAGIYNWASPTRL